MATNTTNYNLVKPAYADTADIADINSNMDVIDGQMKANADGVSANATSLAKSQGGLAYIVGNTNTTGGTLPSGTYVYVKGHSSISEGLRVTTASISNNGSITTSNTSAVSDGGLNSLNSKITIIDSVTYDIPNNTTEQTFDLPSGFSNGVLIAARCLSKYNSWVDASYSNGNYFGDIVYPGNGKFKYTAKVAGNSTQIRFWFIST